MTVAGAERELQAGRTGGHPTLTYADLVQLRAARDGGRDAIVFEGERVSFQRLADEVEAFQRRLATLGVAAGDKVALLGTNTTGWMAAALAVMASGAVVVPLNARDPISELAGTVLASDATHLLYAERYARRELSVLPSELAGHGWQGVAITFDAAARLATLTGRSAPGAHGPVPADLGMILFTSGSTSRPKGCMLTQRGMIRNALLHTERLGIGADDRWFSPMPFFHAGGFVWGITSMLVSGAALVTQPRFDAEGALRLIERERCTYHHGIDAMFVAELSAPGFARERVATVRIANSTGSADLLRRIHEEMGVSGVVSKWGISEGYGNLTLSAPDDPLEKRLETVGRGYPGVEYRIVEPDSGEPLPTGASGEIQVRGSSMEGYYGDPEATSATIDADGWLHTGDRGAFDADGFLHYHGRFKEMLKVGGENVSLAEIESVLMSHPSVQLAVAVGAPHPRLQEVPVAFVVSARGEAAVGAAELERFARERMAGFKVPVAFVPTPIDTIPTSGSGKVARLPLAARAAELVASGDLALGRRR